MLLVLIEDGDDPRSAELLALAGRLGGPARAVVFGDGPADPGAARGYRIRHDLLADYAPEARGESLAQLITDVGPSGVLAAAGERGDEVMAQAAARLGLPLATHCVALDPGEPWSLTRIRGGGMLLEDAELEASEA